MLSKLQPRPFLAEAISLAPVSLNAGVPVCFTICSKCPPPRQSPHPGGRGGGGVVCPWVGGPHVTSATTNLSADSRRACAERRTVLSRFRPLTLQVMGLAGAAGALIVMNAERREPGSPSGSRSTTRLQTARRAPPDAPRCSFGLLPARTCLTALIGSSRPQPPPPHPPPPPPRN